MKDISNLETKMIHNGKRNVKYALVKCSYCGEDKWEQVQRVKRQDNFFCNREHCNLWQKENSIRKLGKEHAKFTYDKSIGVWKAYWHDDDGMHSTTKAAWLWEMNHGKIPKNWVVTYIDENPENCELENLKIMSRSDWNKIHLIGHKVSNKAKKNMSKAHRGKILSEEHKLALSNANKKKWKEGVFDNVHLGKYNRNWKGGDSKDYPIEYNEELRNVIRERDRFRCQVCHVKQNDNMKRAHHVHHMDGDKNNNDLNNLITLCSVCHTKIHIGKDNENPAILAFRSMLKY